VRSWLCWLVVLSFLIVPALGETRSYELLDLHIEAQVGADAVVRITETLRVRFEGTYSGMFRYFDTSRDIAIKDLEVAEGGFSYRRLPGETPGEPGTYFVQEQDGQVLVDWSFSATDEVREFTISYTLHNAILKHNDVAELYYQFVGSGWDRPWQRVQIVLTLPQGAAPDQVGAWGYGPRHGRVTVESPSRIVWEVERLPAETFVEGRVVFPNALVPLGTRYTNENGLERILGEEQRREEARRRAEERRRLDPYVAAVVLLLGYLLVFQIWRSYAKPAPGYKERYYKELPGDYPPAELAFLLRRNVQGQDFTATLLDLARRGYLSIEEITELQARSGRGEANYRFRRREVSRQDLVKLRPYETQILELLFAEGNREELTLAELQEYAKEKAKDFAAFWKEWAEAVEKAAAEHGFFDKEAGKRASWLLVPGFGLLPVAVVAAALEMFITALVMGILGLAVIILVVAAFTRLSPAGREQYTKWQAFRRYLKEFSRVDQVRIGTLGIWEHYLPYAVTLGVADQMLKQLELQIPSMQQGDHRFGYPWLIYHSWSGVHPVSRMTSSLEKSLTSATLPQGVGGSGGFSAGGGGGFGGGGGGAR